MSADLSAPLAGAARADKLKQMAHNHPAFDKARHAQEMLVNVQHAIRSVAGLSATETNALVLQLQEVGQTISQETAQLVQALMNVGLDQEDTDRALARMSIQANFVSAKVDEQAQTIKSLSAEVVAEKEKADKAMAESKIASGRLESLEKEIGTLRGMLEKHKAADVAEDSDLVEVTLSLCGLDTDPQQQMEQSNPQAEQFQEGAPLTESSPLLARPRQAQGYRLTPAVEEEEEGEEEEEEEDELEERRGTEEMDDAMTARPVVPSTVRDHAVSSFQPLQRAASVAPPKFGPLQAGPPRAPSAFAHERRFQSGWGHRVPPSGPGNGNGNGAANHGSSAFGAAFGPTARKPSGGFQPLPRYRPDFHQPGSGFGAPQDGGHHASRVGSAFAHRPSYYPSTPTSAGRHGRFGRFPDGPPTGGVEYGGASMAVVPRNVFTGPPIHLTERVIGAWNEHVMEFYGTIRSFVERFAMDPEQGMVLHISNTSLWPVLLATYHPLSESEAASYLDFHLRNENSKACVVTRLIIDYVVNRVWVPGAWIGSDAKSTYELADLERELDAAQAQSSAARQPLLNQQAAIISHILRNEQGTLWHKSKTDDIARALQTTAQPLMNKHANPHDAFRALSHVADAAWDLSSRILASRLTFDFRFPDIGARFSAQSMLPIWPPLDPAELQAKHWRVALVTTPVITCRNDTGGSISAHSVALADVFCMQ
ncbi:hypothetical protein RJ55_00672 [Drechmeria coniospora]|nr:hypothetical protein RJ55_00672 [Drechmeria coniospora]